MLLAKHFGVASACLGQVEQERQKPGHRGRHRLNQIIYGVRFRRCWAFYDRIDVAMHCLTGFLDIVQPADKALPKLFVFFARQIYAPPEELEMKIFLTACRSCFSVLLF
jgi:hypothetical protein